MSTSNWLWTTWKKAKKGLPGGRLRNGGSWEGKDVPMQVKGFIAVVGDDGNKTLDLHRYIFSYFGLGLGTAYGIGKQSGG